MTDVLSVLIVFRVADLSQNLSDCTLHVCFVRCLLRLQTAARGNNKEQWPEFLFAESYLCIPGTGQGLHEGTCSHAVVTGGPDAPGQLRTESRNSPLRRCRKHPEF